MILISLYLFVCIIIWISKDGFRGRLSTTSHKRWIFSPEPNLDGKQARTRGQCWGSLRTKHPQTVRYPGASQISAKQPKCSECCHVEMCISITRFWPHNETKRACLIVPHCFCKGNNLDCQFSSIGTNLTLLEVAAVKSSSRLAKLCMYCGSEFETSDHSEIFVRSMFSKTVLTDVPCKLRE